MQLKGSICLLHLYPIIVEVEEFSYRSYFLVAQCLSTHSILHGPIQRDSACWSERFGMTKAGMILGNPYEGRVGYCFCFFEICSTSFHCTAGQRLLEWCGILRLA